MAPDLIKNLNAFLSKLKKVRNQVGKENSKTNKINKGSIRTDIGNICDEWFGTYKPELTNLNFSPEIIEKYEKGQISESTIKDYEKAMKNEVPNLWWKTYQKLG